MLIKETDYGTPASKSEVMVTLEIDGHESDGAWRRQTELVQTLALPVLRWRIIDLEHANALGGMRVSQRKGVEAGTQHHDLADTAFNASSQPIFGKPAARGDE